MYHRKCYKIAFSFHFILPDYFGCISIKTLHIFYQMSRMYVSVHHRYMAERQVLISSVRSINHNHIQQNPTNGHFCWCMLVQFLIT